MVSLIQCTMVYQARSVCSANNSCSFVQNTSDVWKLKLDLSGEVTNSCQAIIKLSMASGKSKNIQRPHLCYLCFFIYIYNESYRENKRKMIQMGLIT